MTELSLILQSMIEVAIKIFLSRNDTTILVDAAEKVSIL